MEIHSPILGGPNNTDNTKHISELKNKLSFLDRYRNQNFYSVFPELERLNEYG